jgi:hypothetical protein
LFTAKNQTTTKVTNDIPSYYGFKFNPLKLW